jgi:hypothetical protein
MPVYIIIFLKVEVGKMWSDQRTIGWINHCNNKNDTNSLYLPYIPCPVLDIFHVFINAILQITLWGKYYSSISQRNSFTEWLSKLHKVIGLVIWLNPDCTWMVCLQDHTSNHKVGIVGIIIKYLCLYTNYGLHSNLSSNINFKIHTKKS